MSHLGCKRSNRELGFDSASGGSLLAPEAHTFRCFPMRPADDARRGLGLRVILYDLPCGDWNVTLSDRRLLQDLDVSSELCRTAVGAAALDQKLFHVGRP